MDLVNVNYWAVLVSTVAYFMLGGLWYSPILFGKAWMAAQGLTDADKEKLQEGAVKAYIVSIVSAFIMAFVMAMFVGYASAANLQSGLTTGFFVWLGFVATTVALPYFYEDRSKKVYLMYAGYTLVGCLVMSSILALWQ
ncbi:MAG: DUF1761 domain-containing protein [bacterium]